MDHFLRPDSADLGDMISDATVLVLDQHGAPGFTVSAIARRLHVSPQALTYRFHGARGARRRLVQVATVSLCYRWRAWVEGALLASIPRPALPVTAEEQRGIRAWLSLHELVRLELGNGNGDPAIAIESARAFELECCHRQLERWIGEPVADLEVRRVWALAEGLRVQLLSPGPALSTADAVAMLEADVERVRAGVDIVREADDPDFLTCKEVGADRP